MPILRCPYLMSIPVVYSLLSKPRCQFLLSNPCCQCHDVIPCCLTRCKYKDVFTMLTEPRCHGSLSFWCKTWCKNRRKKALCPRTKRLRFRYYSLFMLSISDIFLFVNKKSEKFYFFRILIQPRTFFSSLQGIRQVRLQLPQCRLWLSTRDSMHHRLLLRRAV